MKIYAFCSILLFFISTVSYASSNSKPPRKLYVVLRSPAIDTHSREYGEKFEEEKNTDELGISSKYRSDLNWDRSSRHNSYKSFSLKNEKELSKSIAKSFIDIAGDVLEKKKNAEKTVLEIKTWPSFVDPNDID